MAYKLADLSEAGKINIPGGIVGMPIKAEGIRAAGFFKRTVLKGLLSGLFVFFVFVLGVFIGIGDINFYPAEIAAVLFA